MVSVKKEEVKENYGFSFGEEDTFQTEDSIFYPEVVNQVPLDNKESKLEAPPAKKPKKSPSTSLFSGNFNCLTCVITHNPSCQYHNCYTCKKRVGSHNALVCKSCLQATHIACMRLPIINLCPKTWKCTLCCPTPTFPSGKLVYTGKVPGIKVGSSWTRRSQLNENRLHAPSMAGIHGTTEGLAYSLVSQGSYVKDDDFGDQFYYTGAGGRDIKETHIKDQSLLSTNRGLAATCDAILSDDGATAFDWKKSAPIRVIRGDKLKKNAPAIAPAEGFRYDGIYKLHRYWKETEPTGFCIWRFHFVRDDDEPSPWTIEGIKYIHENNLKIERSTKFRTFRKKKYNFDALVKPDPSDSGCPNRIEVEFDSPNRTEVEFVSPITPQSTELNFPTQTEPPFSSTCTTIKPEIKTEVLSETRIIEGGLFPCKGNFFDFFPTIQPLISSDNANSLFWTEVSNKIFSSQEDFLLEILSKFTCEICFVLIDSSAPVTTNCGHNFCRSCFRAAVKTPEICCPSCNVAFESLPSKINPQVDSKPAPELFANVNLPLSRILQELKLACIEKNVDIDNL